MTDPFEVDWSYALEDWQRLPYAEAEEVARAVRRFAEGSGGVAIYVEGEYRLVVGALVVAMLIDGATIHVTRVRRA
jgi:hypothetical protein